MLKYRLYKTICLLLLFLGSLEFKFNKMQTFAETLASADYNRKLCKSSNIPYQSCETIFSLLVRETKYYFCQMVIPEEYLKGLADIPYDTRAGIRNMMCLDWTTGAHQTGNAY